MAKGSRIISESVMNNYENDPNKQKIIDIVLGDIGMEADPGEKEKVGLTVSYGFMMGKNKEKNAVLSIALDKKNTFVVLYEKADAGYQYTAMVGRFYEIKEIEFVYEQNAGRDICVLTEIANMKLGAFEKNEFLKGYLWKDETCALVLSVATGIEAYWNTAWTDFQKEKRWERVILNSQKKWLFTESLVLYLYETQNYSVSSNKNSVSLPEENSFEIIDARNLVETYSYHTKWECFILYEAVLKNTRETVAVVQNIENSPYSLVEGPIPHYVVVNQKKETQIIAEKEMELLT